MGQHDPLVSPHSWYQQIAMTVPKRLSLCREMVSSGISDDDVAAIRQYAQRQRALGSIKFQTQIEQQLQRRAGLGQPGRPIKKNYSGPCFGAYPVRVGLIQALGLCPKHLLTRK